MWWKWLYLLVALVLVAASFNDFGSKEITLILDIGALLCLGISVIINTIENKK